MAQEKDTVLLKDLVKKIYRTMGLSTFVAKW